jgi:Tfp pilus assembly protein PilX
MKNPIRNQKGIALIATLMLLVLALGVVAILFRLVTQETKLTRLEQSYTAALDSAKGGADLFIDMIQRGNPSTPAPAFGTNPNPNCLNVKMSNATTDSTGKTWDQQAGWAGCPYSLTQATSTDPTVGTDVTLTLNSGLAPNSGGVPCTVYIKVIDTYQSAALHGANNPNNCYDGCYYYTVISRAQPTGSTQYAEVFFVYRYDMP